MTLPGSTTDEPNELEWDEQIRAQVVYAIDSSHASDFATLLHLIPGLPPEIAAATVDTLIDDPAIGDTAARLAVSAKTKTTKPPSDPVDAVLPLPHPLDHEWRFDPDTRTLLAGLITDHTRADRHVLALGCPTMVLELSERGFTGPMTLIDSNPALPRLLEGHNYRQYSHDLTGGAPPGIRMASVVIADPPFYPDHIHAFIEAAAAHTNEGAPILVSLPSPATRPSAAQDVAGAVAYATTAGLDLVELRPGMLRYRRPPFEREAHDAAGLLGVPEDWRTADLHIFTRSSRPLVPQPRATSAQGTWAEVALGHARIRVRVDPRPTTNGTAIRLLEDIVPGAVLDSVSARDPRRTVANVWTDANGVWRATHPELLVAVLGALAGGLDPLEAAKRHCVDAHLPIDPDALAAEVAHVQEVGAWLKAHADDAFNERLRRTPT